LTFEQLLLWSDENRSSIITTCNLSTVSRGWPQQRHHHHLATKGTIFFHLVLLCTTAFIPPKEYEHTSMFTSIHETSAINHHHHHRHLHWYHHQGHQQLDFQSYFVLQVHRIPPPPVIPHIHQVI
jgi:hypothetical protein